MAIFFQIFSKPTLMFICGCLVTLLLVVIFSMANAGLQQGTSQQAASRQTTSQHATSPQAAIQSVSQSVTQRTKPIPVVKPGQMSIDYEEGLLSLEINNVKRIDVLKALAEKLNFELVIIDDVQAELNYLISLSIHRQSVFSVLSKLLMKQHYKSVYHFDSTLGYNSISKLYLNGASHNSSLEVADKEDIMREFTRKQSNFYSQQRQSNTGSKTTETN